MFRNLITVLVLFIFSHIAYAGFSGETTVEGIVTSFNSKTVTISQRGKKTKVSRKNIPKHFDIKVSNRIYAVVDSKKALKELKKVQGKKKK